MGAINIQNEKPESKVFDNFYYYAIVNPAFRIVDLLSEIGPG
jgi:hypothetical protein